jgi:hypothetical protein
MGPLLFSSILIITFLSAAEAQDKRSSTKPPIKATTEDGRKVLLKDDGTWQFFKPDGDKNSVDEVQKVNEPVKKKVKARAFRGKDELYHVADPSDTSAEYQVDRINEDIITLVPMCSGASDVLQASIGHSLKMDKYHISKLISDGEAAYFVLTVAAKGCLDAL